MSLFAFSPTCCCGGNTPPSGCAGCADSFSTTPYTIYTSFPYQSYYIPLDMDADFMTWARASGNCTYNGGWQFSTSTDFPGDEGHVYALGIEGFGDVTVQLNQASGVSAEKYTLYLTNNSLTTDIKAYVDYNNKHYIEYVQLGDSTGILKLAYNNSVVAASLGFACTTGIPLTLAIEYTPIGNQYSCATYDEVYEVVGTVYNNFNTLLASISYLTPTPPASGLFGFGGTALVTANYAQVYYGNGSDCIGSGTSLCGLGSYPPPIPNIYASPSQPYSSGAVWVNDGNWEPTIAGWTTDAESATLIATPQNNLGSPYGRMVIGNISLIGPSSIMPDRDDSHHTILDIYPFYGPDANYGIRLLSGYSYSGYSAYNEAGEPLIGYIGYNCVPVTNEASFIRTFQEPARTQIIQDGAVVKDYGPNCWNGLANTICYGNGYFTIGITSPIGNLDIDGWLDICETPNLITQMSITVDTPKVPLGNTYVSKFILNNNTQQFILPQMALSRNTLDEQTNCLGICTQCVPESAIGTLPDSFTVTIDGYGTPATYMAGCASTGNPLTSVGEYTYPYALDINCDALNGEFTLQRGMLNTGPSINTGIVYNTSGQYTYLATLSNFLTSISSPQTGVCGYFPDDTYCSHPVYYALPCGGNGNYFYTSEDSISNIVGDLPMQSTNTITLDYGNGNLIIGYPTCTLYAGTLSYLTGIEPLCIGLFPRISLQTGGYSSNYTTISGYNIITANNYITVDIYVDITSLNTDINYGAPWSIVWLPTSEADPYGPEGPCQCIGFAWPNIGASVLLGQYTGVIPASYSWCDSNGNMSSIVQFSGCPNWVCDQDIENDAGMIYGIVNDIVSSSFPITLTLVPGMYTGLCTSLPNTITLDL